MANENDHVGEDGEIRFRLSNGDEIIMWESTYRALLAEVI